ETQGVVDIVVGAGAVARTQAVVSQGGDSSISGGVTTITSAGGGSGAPGLTPVPKGVGDSGGSGGGGGGNLGAAGEGNVPSTSPSQGNDG
ncbi:MAG TPA: hypothetical protein DCS66_11645, partial [Flavobacteriaceae bacterium]|nr:hypothetical protein [Flavobacteriaceae bacterium]